MASDLDAWNDFFGDLSYENGDNPSWQVHELDTTAPFNFDIEPAAGEVSAFQNSVTQDLSFGSGEQLPALPHTTLSNTTFEQAMARLSIVEE